VDLSAWSAPDIPKVLALQERVPELNLILCTGAYLEHAVREEALKSAGEDEMVERMVRHVTQGYPGFEGTGVKAGILKVAANTSRLTDWEKKNFRAAARVQKLLRVPIATHACAGARAQMEFLREQGADIRATFYSHVEAEFGWEGRTLEQEAEYLAGIAGAGGCLQFNNFDFEFDTPFPHLLYLLNYLEDHGLGDRIFISVDANWEMDDHGRIWHEAERRHPETGRRTYAYLITHAVPMLLRAGVSLPRVNKYLTENPRRYFEALQG